MSLVLALLIFFALHDLRVCRYKLLKCFLVTFYTAVQIGIQLLNHPHPFGINVVRCSLSSKPNVMSCQFTFPFMIDRAKQGLWYFV